MTKHGRISRNKRAWDFKPTRDFSSIFAKFQEEEDEIIKNLIRSF